MAEIIVIIRADTGVYDKRITVLRNNETSDVVMVSRLGIRAALRR